MIVRNGLLQQLLIAPAVVNARAPVGWRRPMRRFSRSAAQGDVALVPTAAFRAGLNPTAADIHDSTRRTSAATWCRNSACCGSRRSARNRCQRPADRQGNRRLLQGEQCDLCAKEIRVITQAVVPDQATANAIAHRVRGGQTFAAAAAPAGFSPQIFRSGRRPRRSSLVAARENGRRRLRRPLGGARRAGPVAERLARREDRQDRARGRQIAREARAEIAAKLAADKRKEAIEALSIRSRTRSTMAPASRSRGGREADSDRDAADHRERIVARRSGLQVPAGLAPALKTRLRARRKRCPVVDSLPNDGGYVLVAPARIIAAAPAPLASIRDQGHEDWIADQAPSAPSNSPRRSRPRRANASGRSREGRPVPCGSKP